eukprot:352544-Chlamydomonas_euryale.AAC.6
MRLRRAGGDSYNFDALAGILACDLGDLRLTCTNICLGVGQASGCSRRMQSGQPTDVTHTSMQPALTPHPGPEVQMAVRAGNSGAHGRPNPMLSHSSRSLRHAVALIHKYCRT